MGDRARCSAEASTAIVAMKLFMLLALGAGQIYSQENGMGMTGATPGSTPPGSTPGSGSGMSGSGTPGSTPPGSSPGSTPAGSGYGMGGSGGGSGYGGMGYGMGSGSGMGESGYGGDGDAFCTCCQTKKISGSMYPEKDGIYDLATDGNLRSQILDFGQWPDRCRSHCIYTKRDMVDNERLFCFARSEYSQSKCITE